MDDAPLEPVGRLEDVICFGNIALENRIWKEWLKMPKRAYVCLIPGFYCVLLLPAETLKCADLTQRTEEA